ncbi:MAG: UDP-N-acetylmuramate--L-alanine ligase [Deltaproteobacteria bacterium]|nr:UDP-N-acetylmuramate--L-alanine ligase [Deltaproteobacteria bacterium]
MFSKDYHIFFSGIGGIGMSGIAEILLIDGYRISGSDLKTSDITDRLKSLGANIFEGHGRDNIKNANVLVISSAIRQDNPEVIEAKKVGIPVILRADMLKEIMRTRHTVAVSGAHGKTTTTSLTGEVLIGGNLSPTVVVGGKMIGRGTNALKGKGQYIVAEADESDGSFLKYNPAISIVTNLDREHLDYYDGIDDIKNAFISFINKTHFYGLAILCVDDPYVQEIIPHINVRYLTYGFSKEADLRADNIGTRGDGSTFDVLLKDKKLGTIELGVPGIHNVLNSLAAISTGLELKIDFKDIKKTLSNVKGVKRRLEQKGFKNGVTVVDDYGHHPTEILTTLNAVKKSWPENRVVVMFQPHRFTRTKALFKEFSEAFVDADVLIMLPIYAASEDEIEGISGESLCNEVIANGHDNVKYIERESAVEYLETFLKKGDLLLTLGAGDVVKLGEAFLKRGISK